MTRETERLDNKKWWSRYWLKLNHIFNKACDKWQSGNLEKDKNDTHDEHDEHDRKERIEARKTAFVFSIAFLMTGIGAFQVTKILNGWHFDDWQREIKREAYIELPLDLSSAIEVSRLSEFKALIETTQQDGVNSDLGYFQNLDPRLQKVESELEDIRQLAEILERINNSLFNESDRQINALIKDIRAGLNSDEPIATDDIVEKLNGIIQFETSEEFRDSINTLINEIEKRNSGRFLSTDNIINISDINLAVSAAGKLEELVIRVQNDPPAENGQIVSTLNDIAKDLIAFEAVQTQLSNLASDIEGSEEPRLSNAQIVLRLNVIIEDLARFEVVQTQLNTLANDIEERRNDTEPLPETEIADRINTIGGESPEVVKSQLDNLADDIREGKLASRTLINEYVLSSLQDILAGALESRLRQEVASKLSRAVLSELNMAIASVNTDSIAENLLSLEDFLSSEETFQDTLEAVEQASNKLEEIDAARLENLEILENEVDNEARFVALQVCSLFAKADSRIGIRSLSPSAYSQYSRFPVSSYVQSQSREVANSSSNNLLGLPDECLANGVNRSVPAEYRDEATFILLASELTDATPGQKLQIVQQMNRAKVKGRQAYRKARYYYVNYFSALLILFPLGVFTSYLLFQINQDGWGKANLNLKTIFFTASASVFLLFQIPLLFKYEDNYSAQSSIYLGYEQLQNDIKTYLVTRYSRGAVEGAENTLTSNTQGEPTPREFIYLVERSLERLTRASVIIQLDRTALPNYSEFFVPFIPPRPPSGDEDTETDNPAEVTEDAGSKDGRLAPDRDPNDPSQPRTGADNS